MIGYGDVGHKFEGQCPRRKSGNSKIYISIWKLIFCDFVTLEINVGLNSQNEFCLQSFEIVTNS